MLKYLQPILCLKQDKTMPKLIINVVINPHFHTYRGFTSFLSETAGALIREWRTRVRVKESIANPASNLREYYDSHSYFATIAIWFQNLIEWNATGSNRNSAKYDHLQHANPSHKKYTYCFIFLEGHLQLLGIIY